MKQQSLYHKNSDLKKEQLMKNNGKYRLFNTETSVPVGSVYVMGNKVTRPLSEQNNGLLSYTYGENSEYGKTLNETYGRDVETLKTYVVPSTKISYKVNDYEGKQDYREYAGDVYGNEKTYLGHLYGLVGVQDVAQRLTYDIFPDMEGKTFADYINEIRQYGDVKYAMEKDSVGIVRDIRVADALAGIITTNINNYSGKDTRLGTIGNTLYAQTLFNGASFNSLRRTKYITSNLETVYGNNLSNVNNLSSLFTIDSETGRYHEVSSDNFIGYPEAPIHEYVKQVNKEFELPSEKGVWNKGYSYISPYYGFKKLEDGWGSDAPSRPITAYEYYSTTEGVKDEGRSTFQDVQVKNISSEKLGVNKGENLLNKTNQLFKDKKIKTMIGEYFTGENDDKTPSLTQSAVTERFGISHGRNLLTKDAWLNGSAPEVGGYKNPYCRVWTYHNQYSKMKDLIRPFSSKDENGNITFIGIGELQKGWGVFRPNEVSRLGDNTVINENGMINITPTNEARGEDITKCMFSIENLAWKDVNFEKTNKSKGPNKGRIMWFPPYDIKFQENVAVNWNKTEFIGRGEPVYTYTNTQRSGTLSFTMLVDHPAILDYWMLNKRNSADDNDEQTALRFFAGCETINPAKETIDLLSNFPNNGGNLNFKDAGKFKNDEVFYVFYPYGHDGGNDFKKIFQGYGKDGEQVALTKDSVTMEAFLGYEMSNSPISTKFEIIDGPIENLNSAWSLYRIIDEKEFNKHKDDSKNTTELKIEWDGGDKGFIKKTYDNISKYNVSKGNNEDNTEKIEDIDTEITSVTGEITKLTGIKYENDSFGDKDVEDEDNWTEDSKLKVLKKQIDTAKDNSKKRELKEKLEGFKKVLSTKNKQFISLKKQRDKIDPTKQENTDAKKDADIVDEVGKLFNGKSVRFIKTNVLYFRMFDGEISEGSDTFSNTYISYKKENLDNQYKNQEEAEKKFYNDYSDINACNCKEGGYFKIGVEGIKDGNIDSHLNVYGSKSQFKKSEDRMCLCKGKYLIKSDDDSIVEVDTYDELTNGLRVYKDDNAFMKSSDKIGKVGTSANVTIKTKKLTSIKEEDVIKAIESTLPKKGNAIDEDKVKEIYFAGRLYESYEELEKMKNKNPKSLDYGYVQYFAEMKSDCPIYDSLQDFVIDSQLKLSYINPVKIERETYKEAYVKHTDGDSHKYYKIKATLSYQDEDANCQYPTSASNIKGVNTIVIGSMGLNSTYEVVKEYMKDDKITCSFGEYYAALNGEEITEGEDGKLVVKKDDKITQFVLKCEESVLKSIGKFDETKIEEAKKRINNIRKVITSSEYKDNINGIRVISSKEESNMINSRDKNIQNFIKSGNNLGDKNFKFTENNKEDNKEDNKGQEIKENETVTSIRKGRNTKVQIVLGAFDDITNKRQGEETDEFGQYKQENDVKMSYGNEYLFFSGLEENNSIAYKRLVDKVKYFSPAYHSMTPEGFNERLTFLHQCTRQGNIKSTAVAKNLSFGPPPVCVLRLGDFLNTKIVITGLSISYPDSKWDFNQEGIGMQFMMAEVQMNIDIIGGSDIVGPINQLQNAMSFNYYANTFVYEKEGNNGVQFAKVGKSNTKNKENNDSK